jgi:hypothetical protein
VTARAALVAVVLALLLAPGCRRHYVKDPDAARGSHDLDWTVDAEPAPRGAATP